jgi:nucleoid DNA-binding protein/very-short-patch-repair endonuclease
MKIMKKTIIGIISSIYNILKRKFRIVLNAILSDISGILSKGKKIVIRNLGTKTVKKEKSSQMCSIHTEQNQIVNSQDQISFKVSADLRKLLNEKDENCAKATKRKETNHVHNHKKSSISKPKVIIDSSGCKIIYSQPNQEQTSDLKIGYLPIKEIENRVNFPIVIVPEKNSFLKLPREGRSNIRGYKEDDFWHALSRSDLDIEISNNLHIAVSGRMLPYEPDFVLFDKNINLYIDVEIDEPYDGYSRIPTHIKDGYDQIRNLFFRESGWVVIRFTERQIHQHLEECIGFLRSIVQTLQLGQPVGPVRSLVHEELWDYKQAVVWARDLYREKYLGIQAFNQLVREVKIICENNTDPIETKIQRTARHTSSVETKTVDTSHGLIKGNTSRIIFDEGTHTYYPEEDRSGNTDYVSVTTLIEKFFPTFDEDAYIKKRIEETGESEEAIRKELQDPSQRGTCLHKQIEMFLKGQSYNGNMKEFQLFQSFYRECILTRNLSFYGAEMSILLPEHNIAGTVDSLFRKANGEFVMVDWKRSKHLIIDGYPKKYGFGRGLSVLSHLDNSSYYKYELQQSFYRYILEHRYHIHISSMILAVLHPDYDRYYSIKLSTYREKEVEEMIEINDTLMK